MEVVSQIRRSVEDIHEKFAKFFCCLPLKCILWPGKSRRASPNWSKQDGLHQLPETKKIKNELLGELNRKGFTIINSQAAVNGERSDSPSFGGYVYQKAYVEFFCSKEKLDSLVEKCRAHPSLTYMAVNRQGSCWISNVAQADVNAVTWGVFPTKEIIERTVDPARFRVWKDEAFEIWSERLLEEDVHNSYYRFGFGCNIYASTRDFRSDLK